MEISFYKLHILRNDLILADLRKEQPGDVSVLSDIAVKLCDRHTGAGANGTIFITDSDSSRSEIHTFAPDGSYYDFSADSSLAASRYIYDRLSVDNSDIHIINNNKEYTVRAIDSTNFRIKTGTPVIESENAESLIYNNFSYRYTRVRIGKTGVVFFPDNKSKDFLKNIHNEILKSESLSMSQPIFVKPLSPDIIQIKAWKNRMNTDNALTVSSGAAAAVLNGYENSLLVNFFGTKAFAEWDQINNETFITAEPEYIYTGQYYYDE